MRWNSPPNWPTPPPGWTPPQGWQPDPSWGPAPQGHQFWVDEHGPAGQPMAGWPDQTPPGNHRSKMLAIIGAVLAVVVLIGAAVFLLVRDGDGDGGNDDEAGEDSSQEPDSDSDEGDRSSDDPTVSEPELTAPEPVEPDPAEGDLALGDSSAVGAAWTVSIDEFTPDADEVIAQTNEFNEPPSGRYVIVDVTTDYAGDTEGLPWVELGMAFLGSDGAEYDSSDCLAVLPEPTFEVPSLQPGESASYQQCFDVPPDAIEGGQLSVVESFAVEESAPVVWSLG